MKDTCITKLPVYRMCIFRIYLEQSYILEIYKVLDIYKLTQWKTGSGVQSPKKPFLIEYLIWSLQVVVRISLKEALINCYIFMVLSCS